MKKKTYKIKLINMLINILSNIFKSNNLQFTDVFDKFIHPILFTYKSLYDCENNTKK